MEVKGTSWGKVGYIREQERLRQAARDAEYQAYKQAHPEEADMPDLPDDEDNSDED